jgi:hypothetical protein
MSGRIYSNLMALTLQSRKEVSYVKWSGVEMIPVLVIPHSFKLASTKYIQVIRSTSKWTTSNHT